MRTSAALVFVAAGIAADPGFGQGPLSAIDWLSGTVAEPGAMQLPAEGAAAGGISTGAITVTPLGHAGENSVGLLSASATGLPRDLWGPTSSEELSRLLAGINTGLLPSAQNLLLTVLLAELDPPGDSDPFGALFLARIDALLALGAVEQAHALLERAGPSDPARFRRWFDTSLLLRTESAACDTLMNSPGLSQELADRIFCLAQRGDWTAAALALEAGHALGELPMEKSAALARFLHHSLSDSAPPLPRPHRPTPLDFRLHEAIGEPLPTTTLPLAFAHADLSANKGWKSRIEAAERLARSGIAEASFLLQLYTEQLPAASGGVWERAAAVQRLDLALASADTPEVAAALSEAWSAMQRVGLEAVFAYAYAPRISNLPLSEDAGELAFRIQLLGLDYRTAAQNRAPANASERFLKALARGDLAGMVPPDDTARAIADGFSSADLPPSLERLLANRAFGSALLRAIAMLGGDAADDPDSLGNALALLRALGVDDVARRVAIEAAVLDRSG